MWQQCAVLLEGQHLASTPMDTNKSACVMGVTLLRVFAPLQGGGFLTAHHGLFFVYFCQPIDALPSPILQEPRQPIDNLPLLLLHFLSR